MPGCLTSGYERAKPWLSHVPQIQAPPRLQDANCKWTWCSEVTVKTESTSQEETKQSDNEDIHTRL